MTIADVTTALHEIVAGAIGTAKGATVRIGPPRPIEPGEGEVNICFYRLEPNAVRRNENLPTRTPGGLVPAKAQSAFDLHYLIAFGGEPLDGETMLGNVLTALGAMPVLTAEDIQSEPIRVVPEYLSLEDLARLWGAFQLPLRPSLQYIASPVLLET